MFRKNVVDNFYEVQTIAQTKKVSYVTNPLKLHLLSGSFIHSSKLEERESDCLKHRYIIVRMLEVTYASCKLGACTKTSLRRFVINTYSYYYDTYCRGQSVGHDNKYQFRCKKFKSSTVTSDLARIIINFVMEVVSVKNKPLSLHTPPFCH